ncbi:MAG: sodium transport system permease protein [Fimbriimonadaceae bacterium]|jgi:sodium transport system permease protein|nr:sodium transport system permease protein [Fimbriimonadaceae bacterium]
MNKQALLVYTKEAREMLRDKRVRSSALFGPFFLVFIMMMSFGTLIEKIKKPSFIKVHVVRSNVANPFVEALRKSNATVIEVGSLDEGRRLIQDGKASIILQFQDNYKELLSKGQPTTIQAVYDSKEQRSEVALSVMQRMVSEQNKKTLEALMETKGLPAAFAAPVQIKSEDATRAKGTNELLLALLPYLIVFWAFIGGVSAASDLVAGEKERNTLETLLITPVPRTKLVWGKFLALATLCFMSSLSGLAAVYVAAYSHLPGMDTMFKNGSGLEPAAVAAIILVLIPTVLFFASVLIAISTYAKNTREAQTYLSLTSLLVSFPALASQFIGFSDAASARWISLIPVLNASAAVRSALIGKLDATTVLLTTGTSAVLAIISIVVAVRLFNREEVLLRV